jgi:glycerophosphoryl diester phosphodiesterase
MPTRPRPISLISLAVLLAATSAFAADAPAPLPKLKHRIAVIAHRGGRALAPENTFAAFRKAIKLGADYVEIDVRATRDNALVLMHDGTVDRTTNGTGAVADMDLEALRRLDAGVKFSPAFAGTKIPTFGNALDLCRNHINIYLDHKEGPLPQILAVLREHGMERHVVIYDGLDEAREWKRLAPDIPVMLSPPDQYRQVGGIADLMKLIGAEVLDGHFLEWTPALVRAAHRAGAMVYVDNLGVGDNEEGYRHVLEMHVDGIQTDHPDRLLAFLRAARPASPSGPTHQR